MSIIVCNPDDRHWLQELGVTSADDLMSFRPEKILAISGSSETFKVDLDSTLARGAPRQIFVKRYRYGSYKALLQGLFRGILFGRSRAQFEFEVLSEMQRRGVRVVRPIAYAEKRRRRTLRSCVLVTEGEGDAETLSSYYSSQSSSWNLSTKRRLISAVGRSVAELHGAGILHGGLFWRNVLVADTGKDGWNFTLLDPSRRFKFYSGTTPLSAAVSDLSDFVASATTFLCRTDIARFLRSYEESRGRSDTRRSVARAIVNMSIKKTRQEKQRIAMGTTLSWLQRRIQRGASAPGRVAFESLPAFLAAAGRVDLGDVRHRGRAIRLELLDRGGADETQVYGIVFGPHDVHVERGVCQGADLHIRTDTDALLAVINAQPGAFDAIQSGRFELNGDVRLLALLAQLVDTQATSSAMSEQP